MPQTIGWGLYQYMLNYSLFVFVKKKKTESEFWYLAWNHIEFMWFWCLIKIKENYIMSVAWTRPYFVLFDCREIVGNENKTWDLATFTPSCYKIVSDNPQGINAFQLIHASCLGIILIWSVFSTVTKS